MQPCPPAASFLLASTGLFELRICSPVVPLPGSQGAAPSQVDTVSSHDTPRSGQSGCFHPGPLALTHSWQRLWFALALLRQCPRVAPRARACLRLAPSRVRVWPRFAAVFPAHALPCHTMSRAPTLRVLWHLLSQTCSQVRC